MMQKTTETEIKKANQKTATERNKMQSKEFLYWLQGLFEVGFATQLSKEQVKIINNHLFITIKDHPFISWIDGFLSTQAKGVSKENTKILKYKLEECFINFSKEKFSDLLERLTLEPNIPRHIPNLPNTDLWKMPPLIC